MKSSAILLCVLVVLLPFISADEESEKKQDINFERGQDVLVLNCSLTNLPDKVEWSKEGVKLEMSANEKGEMTLTGRENVVFTHSSKDNVHSMTITKPKITDVGNYTCSSVSTDADAQVLTENFAVLMPTMVYKIVAVNNIIDGEALLLTCKVIGNPPTEIQWYKVPEPESKDPKDQWMVMDAKIKIESDDSHIHTNSTPLNTTMTSYLHIPKIELDDRFIYMCLADNTDNVVAMNSTILIRVVGKYAALWPFLGICAEVLILCIVIFIYEKQHSNKKFDEDNDQTNSKHAVNSKDSEVRHRK